MKIKLSILFMLVYCGTLLINLPASVFLQWMNNSPVTVHHASGSLWRGEAKEVNVNPSLTLRNVKWNIDFGAFLRATLAAKVSFDNGIENMFGQGDVQYKLSSGISASNVVFHLSSKTLLKLLQLQLPIDIDGDFSVTIKKVQLDYPYCKQLNGVINWKNAYIYTHMGNIDLASPKVDLSCQNSSVNALLNQRSKQLSTVLEATIDYKGKYQVSGEIKPTKQLESAIAQSLTWAGKLDDNGATVINFDGKF